MRHVKQIGLRQRSDELLYPASKQAVHNGILCSAQLTTDRHDGESIEH